MLIDALSKIGYLVYVVRRVWSIDRKQAEWEVLDGEFVIIGVWFDKYLGWNYRVEKRGPEKKNGPWPAEFHSSADVFLNLKDAEDEIRIRIGNAELCDPSMKKEKT